MKSTVDFSRNPKQEQFFRLALGSAAGKNDFRHLFYGGAIRGGKTYVSLAILAFLCKKYPNSRWHVFRKDFPAVNTTAIQSMERILAGNPKWKWNRDKSNYFAYNRVTESKIFFKGENIDRDPELNDLLGLETNGILYEQIEELSQKLWQMGNSRLGSWYTEPLMPKPITLATFNPSQAWIKEMIYEPYRKGELKVPYFYMTALPSDNGYVTKDQWEGWNRLDDRYKAQFIEGDWTDFADKNGLWAFAFDRAKHVSAEEIKPVINQYLYLSFDFNKNPICCSVIQHIDNQIRVIETIKLANSDIYALCRHILTYYGQYTYIVTGDASGSNTTALVQDNLNFYTVIKKELSLSQGQLKVPTVNPRLADNQVLVNSLLANYDIKINAEKGKHLIYDLANVKMLADGTINKGEGAIRKANRNDPTQQADALDTFRYYCNIFHSNFLRL